MIKVLYVNGGVLDMGGISSYMMNFYRHFDKNTIHIDFLTQGMGKNLYIEELNKEGSIVYQIPNKSKNLIKNVQGMYKIIKKGEYDIVHAHADAGNGLILYLSKLAGVKIRISHSHSTNFYTQSKIKQFLNTIQKKSIVRNATHFWRCSKEACEWLYPSNRDYLIVNNAIDLTKFKFDLGKRESIRRELGLCTKSIALCQIGHFNYIKNQEYSIKVVEKILTIKKESLDIKLFFIGDGEEREKIEILAKKSIAKENIIFLGKREDVFNIIQGMDVLLLPSKFEGFPVTIVESQAAGLFSLVSEKVTKECCFDNHLVKILSIDIDSVDEWAHECICIPAFKREEGESLVRRAGFDIEIEASKLQRRYLDLVKGE